MSVYKDYTAERGQGELLELVRRYHVFKGLEVTDEALKETFRRWRDYVGIFFDGSLWEYAQKKVEDAECLAKIDVEALTCEGRRRAIASCLGEPLEDYTDPLSVLGLYQEDLRWLQARTGEEDNELIKDFESLQSAALQILFEGLMSQSQEELDQVNKLERKFDLILVHAHRLMLKEKQRLERKLLVMTLKARKPAIFRLKVYVPSFRRAHSRSPRSARRASFSVAASSPGGGDSSGDPDSGDPPGPYPFRIFVTPPSNSNPNRRPSRPWLGLGCCRMERGRSAW